MLIVILSLTLAFLCLAFFLFAVVFPALAGMRRGPVVAERVRRVQNAGERLGGGRCGGYLSGVNYGGPFLSISVYPDGILICPMLAPAAVIMRDEIRRIEWKSRGNRVEIDHRSPDILSPIRLYVAMWTDIGSAIKAFEEQLQTEGDSGSSG